MRSHEGPVSTSKETHGRRRRLAILFLFGLTAGVLSSATLQAAEASVFPDADSVEPLIVGSRIPTAMVRNIDGEAVDLAKRIGDRGALLVFYRGGW